MPKQNKTILAIVADTHIGSTVALCPPVVNLDDGGTYRASRFQHWLWECWKDYWGQVKKAKSTDNRLIVVVNGDAVELDAKRRSTQLITTNRANVLSMAVDTLAPMYDATPDEVIFVRGTAAHTGKSGSGEESLAADLGAKKSPYGTYTWWEVLAKIGGVQFDISHHGRMGRLPWSEKNSLHRLAREVQLAYLDRGQRPPDVVVRSHNHRWGDTYDNEPVRVISTPAWQLKTEFGYRIGSTRPADIGGLLFVLDGSGAVPYDTKIIYPYRRGAFKVYTI